MRVVIVVNPIAVTSSPQAPQFADPPAASGEAIRIDPNVAEREMGVGFNRT